MNAIIRVVKAMILMTIVGLGSLLVSNALRGRWSAALIELLAVAAAGGLYYLLTRRPRWVYLAGWVLAALMLLGPPFAAWFDPPNVSPAVPLLAIGGVMIFSLLQPRMGLFVIALETIGLAVVSLLTPYVTLYTAVSFFAVATAIHLVSRLLLEALIQAEAMQAKAVEQNQQLEQALARIEEKVAQQERQMRTIRELQMPLIESGPGTGLLVLVGHCDAERLRTVQEDLFARLEQRGLRRLVVDVSAAVLDDQGLDMFLQTLQALRLMVTDIVLCGVRPELAADWTADRDCMAVLRATVRFAHSLQEALADRVAVME